MSKSVGWNKILLLLLLWWKTLYFAPVCGWLAAPPISPTETGRRLRLLQVQSWQSTAALVRSTRITTPTALYKKKGAGSGGTSTASSSSSKKIQVQLLRNVPGTGQAGEVVLVTPAFFNNMLRPTSLAKEISKEQVERELAEKTAKEQQQDQRALELKERVEQSVELKLRRKVGPNGQLFGGVGPKMVMEILYAAISDDFLRQKSVKITAIMTMDGKKIEGDIKTIGTFTATISLTKEHSAKLRFKIEAEEG